MTNTLSGLDFRREDIGSFLLVESLRANPEECAVSFVDIEGGLLGQIGQEGSSQRYIGPLLSFAQPLDDGAFLLGAGARIGLSLTKGVVQWTPKLLPPAQRFNDATVDMLGRLVVGTLNLSPDSGNEDNRLFVLENDGTLVTIRRNVGLSNGIAVEPKSGDLFHVDTRASTIHRIPLNRDSGAYGAPDLFHTFQPNENPDGVVLLESGELLVALWGNGSIVTLDAQGREIDRAPVPPVFPTSVCICNSCGELWLGSASQPRESLDIPFSPGSLWRSTTHLRQAPSHHWNSVPLENVKLGKH